MPSQMSYENRIGRFENGLALLQTWGDYLPANVLITIAVLLTFVADVRAKNEEVANLLTNLTNNRNLRKPQVFKTKTSDLNCLQNRIDNIVNYLKAEFGKTSGACQQVYSLFKRISPTYPKKKEPNLPRGSGRSPSERSFVAVTGYGYEVHAIINSLGATYNPSNTAITVVNFKTFLDTLNTLNKDIAVDLKNYGDAVNDRIELYEGAEGLDNRMSMIKSYLASFPGGKTGQKYVEYTQSIEGV